jgi:molecular chaperone GrpE
MHAAPWWAGSDQVSDPRHVQEGQAAPEAVEPEHENSEPAPSAELESILAERDRYLDQLQRTSADLANFRRRTEQERAQQRLLANEQLLRDFLPVLDDLQRGLGAIPADEQDSKVAEGMRLVEQKLLSTLRRHGVSPIDSLGLPFDPALHEAVEADPAGGNFVTAVYAPGYKLGDGMLRPAMVKVGLEPTG